MSINETISTIFARATRMFKGNENIAGGKAAVVTEIGKSFVYLPIEHVVESTVYNVESALEWFKSYAIEPTVAFADMLDLINGDIAYTRLAVLKVLASNGYEEERTCELVFRVSKELDDWRKAFGRRFTPQEFRRFLQNRREEYNDGECELFQSMCNLNMSVSRDYELEDDGGVDRKVHFQVKAGEDFTHLPRFFNLEVPMLFGDDKAFSIPVELEFELPEERNGNRPAFVMSCEFLDRLMIERIKACVEDFEEKSGLKTILGSGRQVETTQAYRKVIGG